MLFLLSLLMICWRYVAFLRLCSGPLSSSSGRRVDTQRHLDSEINKVMDDPAINATIVIYDFREYNLLALPPPSSQRPSFPQPPATSSLLLHYAPPDACLRHAHLESRNAGFAYKEALSTSLPLWMSFLLNMRPRLISSATCDMTGSIRKQSAIISIANKYQHKRGEN